MHFKYFITSYSEPKLKSSKPDRFSLACQPEKEESFVLQPKERKRLRETGPPAPASSKTRKSWSSAIIGIGRREMLEAPERERKWSGGGGGETKAKKA